MKKKNILKICAQWFIIKLQQCFSCKLVEVFLSQNRLYKLKYIDNVIKFDSTIHSAFGKALHKAIESKIINEQADGERIFINNFREELRKIPQEIRKEKYSPEMMMEFKDQGCFLISQFLSEFRGFFSDGYEVIGVEEKLEEKIPDVDLTFLGFVDLVVRDKGTNKYWILDHKSTTWGWDAKKKRDKLAKCQLSLYKYFWGEKHNISLPKIETAFILLKRSAKRDHIERLLVANTKKRVEGAVKMLVDTVKLLEKGFYIKNFASCDSCFHKQECLQTRWK
jgi:hypothetical protein